MGRVGEAVERFLGRFDKTPPRISMHPLNTPDSKSRFAGLEGLDLVYPENQSGFRKDRDFVIVGEPPKDTVGPDGEVLPPGTTVLWEQHGTTAMATRYSAVINGKPVEGAAGSNWASYNIHRLHRALVVRGGQQS